MGWWGIGETRLYDKKEIIEKAVDEVNEWKLNEKKYQVLKHSAKGTKKEIVLYMAVKHPNGNVFGLVNLIEDWDGEWMKKELSEEMGPAYHDCPESILKLLTKMENNEYGENWRKKCWEKINKQKELKNKVNKLVYGSVVKFSEAIEFSNGEIETTFIVIDKIKSIFKSERIGMCNIRQWKDRPFETLKV